MQRKSETFTGEFRDQEKVFTLLGQLYSDPRDVVNEFLSNAADEYKLANIQQGIIRIRLVRSGMRAHVHVEDHGRGMTKAKLRKIGKSLALSEKALDPSTIGEKGIGIVGFQAIARRSDIVSRPEGHDDTWCLSLKQGSLEFALDSEAKRKRTIPGTDVYLYGITKENWRLLSLKRLASYFKERRRAALLRGEYRLQIVQGKQSAWVMPDQYAGSPFHVTTRRTPYGPVKFNLWLGRGSVKRKKRIALIGKGGTTIVEDITSIPEFDGFPWNSDKVEGDITFEPLEQISGRRGVVRDRKKFPEFLEATESVKDELAKEVTKVASELDKETEGKILSALRRTFRRVLRELATMDSPFKTGVPSPDGEVRPGTPTLEAGEVPGGQTRRKKRKSTGATLPAVDRTAPGTTRQKITKLPTIYYDDQLGSVRSRFDEGLGVIFVNDAHQDYLAVKAEPLRKYRYLMMLIAKEYVLWNNPHVQSEAVSEELVGFLAKAWKHSPAL